MTSSGCESLHKNIHLMLDFLKTPFLVLHFSYYTLMTFLMMLSVILLSMLMILLSTLSVATTRIGFWTWSDQSNNTGAIDVKMDVFFEEKLSFKMLGVVFLLLIRLGLLHYLYWQNYLQENWSLDSFCEVTFSWSCSVNL